MRVAGPLLWAMAGLLLTPLHGESTIQPRCDLYSLPGCPRNFSPVCGTDGETYANECMLCMSNKSAKRHIIYHTDTGENLTRIFK